MDKYNDYTTRPFDTMEVGTLLGLLLALLLKLVPAKHRAKVADALSTIILSLVFITLVGVFLVVLGAAVVAFI